MLTTRISPKKQITIPVEIFRQLGLAIGDYLGAKIENEKIVFIPAKIVPKSQMWFWTKEWQEKEKKATGDIRANRIKGPFNSSKGFIKSLKSKR